MGNRTQRIKQRYNANFDIIRGGPAVTWAEMSLALEIEELRSEVETLRTAFAAACQAQAKTMREYARHKRNCALRYDTLRLPTTVCTCGYTSAVRDMPKAFAKAFVDPTEAP